MLNVVYPERSVTNENAIQLKVESLLEFCVRNGNKELLQLVLQTELLNVECYRTQLVKALELDGGSGLRLNDGFDVKLEIVG